MAAVACAIQEAGTEGEEVHLVPFLKEPRRDPRESRSG